MDKDKKIEQDDFVDGLIIAEDEWSELEKSLALQVNEQLVQNAIEKSKNKKEKTSLFHKIPIGIRVAGLIFFMVILVGCGYLAVKYNGIYGQFDATRLDEQFDEDENAGLTEVSPEDILLDASGQKRKEDYVTNILLVGEEAIGSGSSRGRTDCIMIASINTLDKTLSLTSLMRDMYVQIPGYSDNKLNAAYGSGGIPLLEETIELNFELEIDGAVLVNFEGFETIIDKLGGVEIYLSEDEAYYLNTTNYISNPIYRTVKSGMNTLNGNQALGYMRIRYVKTTDNSNDDFGRTSRQRTLLNAVFDKYKTKKLGELMVLLDEVFPYVTTDIEMTEMVSYLTSVVTMGATELKTLRIPLNSMYDSCYVRKMAVLVPHLQENVEALHTFLFGSEENIETQTDKGYETSQTENSEEKYRRSLQTIWLNHGILMGIF